MLVRFTVFNILELYSELYSLEMIHWDDPLQREIIYSVWLEPVIGRMAIQESPGGPGSEFIKQLILDYLVVIKLEPARLENPTQN